MTIIETKDIASGQLLRVHHKIVEGEKTRTQVFEGTVIKRRGGNTPNATFTIRKKSKGDVWVEKIFPVQLPTIEKVELVKEFQKRRAQMTFLRNVKYKKKLKEVVTSMIGKKHKATTPEPEAKVEEPKAEAVEAKTEEPKAEEVKPKAEEAKPETTEAATAAEEPKDEAEAKPAEAKKVEPEKPEKK